MVESKFLYLEAASFTCEDDDFVSTHEYSRADTNTSWDFGNVAYITEDREFVKGREQAYLDHPVDDLDLNGAKIAYVVVAVWSDGDSFHRDNGRHAEIMGVFVDKDDAYDFEKQLKSSEPLIVNLRRIRRPWDGYFESLDYIDVIHCEVKEF